MKRTAILIVCALALTGCGLVPSFMNRSKPEPASAPFEGLPGVKDDTVDTALEWGAILAGAIPGVGIGIASILASVRKVRKARQQQFNAQIDLISAKHRNRERSQESETVIADLVGNIEQIKSARDGLALTQIQQELMQQLPETRTAVRVAKNRLAGLFSSKCPSPSAPQ